MHENHPPPESAASATLTAAPRVADPLEQNLGRIFAGSLLLVVVAASPHMLATLALVEGLDFVQPRWLFWLSGSAQVLATVGATATVSKLVIQYRRFRLPMACLALLCFLAVNVLVAMPKAAHLGGVSLPEALAPQWVADHWWFVLYAALPWLALEVAVATLAAGTAIAGREVRLEGELIAERDAATERAARAEDALRTRLDAVAGDADAQRDQLADLRDQLEFLTQVLETEKGGRLTKARRRQQILAFLTEQDRPQTVEQIGVALGLGASSIRLDLNEMATTDGPLLKIAGRPVRFALEIADGSTTPSATAVG